MWGLYITNIGSLLKNQCSGQYEDFFRGPTGLHKKPPNEKNGLANVYPVKRYSSAKTPNYQKKTYTTYETYMIFYLN